METKEKNVGRLAKFVTQVKMPGHYPGWIIPRITNKELVANNIVVMIQEVTETKTYRAEVVSCEGTAMCVGDYGFFQPSWLRFNGVRRN